jgi:hypothetical protein
MTALPTSLTQRAAALEERLAETALLPRVEKLEKIRQRGELTVAPCSP